MTAPAHAMVVATILHTFGCPDAVNVILSFTGAFPDLGALDETLHGKYDGRYHLFHYETPWLWFWMPTGLHLLIDRVTHRPDGKWYWWAYVIEVLFWAFQIWYWFF